MTQSLMLDIWRKILTLCHRFIAPLIFEFFKVPVDQRPSIFKQLRAAGLGGWTSDFWNEIMKFLFVTKHFWKSQKIHESVQPPNWSAFWTAQAPDFDDLAFGGFLGNAMIFRKILYSETIITRKFGNQLISEVGITLQKTRWASRKRWIPWSSNLPLAERITLLISTI